MTFAKYRITDHEHPYAPELINRLARGSVRLLQAADTQSTPDDPKYFFEHYRLDQNLVSGAPPRRQLEFARHGAYAAYNWELFFHVPFAIAVHLMRNQRFAEAQRWFHFIFDPTDDSSGPSPQRFWKVRPFRTTELAGLEQRLLALASAPDATGVDTQLRDETLEAIAQWRRTPFQPHAVARVWQTPYMYRTVMAYLDNLIAWGDSLFRQDTREAINEATQLYVLAANILGPKPQAIPRAGQVKPRTYADLRARLGQLGQAAVELETEFPFDFLPMPEPAAGDSVPNAGEQAAVAALRRTLYFCVPSNQKLVGYWNVVGDRLFKIRNSLNLQGTFRRLALFDPPIDPAVLVRSAAAGLDVAAIAAGLHQPLPLVRFTFLAQKATELAQELKSLGANLLSILEKEDGEALSVLRARHEKQVLGLAETVRYGQWQEAIKAREGLELSLQGAFARYSYFERLLGRDAADLKLPELEPFEKETLLRLKVRTQEPALNARPIEISIAADAEEKRKLSPKEQDELVKLERAQVAQDVAAGLDGVAGALRIIPKFVASAAPLGVGAQTEFGGDDIAEVFQLAASVSRAASGRFSYEAGRAAKMAGHERREQDWTFQSNNAAQDVSLIFKQLRAAQLREAIAEREWLNHKEQMKNAEQIEAFLTNERGGKKTNQAFYAWMKREAKGVYSAAYELAFEIARKAERALQHELGDPDLAFIGSSYLSGREGLLAGEKLFLDLKKMEHAHEALRQSEHVLVKWCSLLDLDPEALLQLRATGECTFSIPEEAFDLDRPGHYFRRLKSVALSLPSVTGPDVSVHCTVRLLSSRIRKSADAGGPYAWSGPEDARFSDFRGQVESMVTSAAVEDDGSAGAAREGGLATFEGRGAISEWSLSLPKHLRQFDYQSIADAKLTLRFSAREGGEALEKAAVDHLSERLKSAGAAGAVRLFSVRSEFPNAWAKFQGSSADANGHPLEFDLTRESYPYWARKLVAKLERATLIVRARAAPTVKVSGSNVPIRRLEQSDLYSGPVQIGPQATGAVKLSMNTKAVDDVLIAVRWMAG